jgi:hypothetical protein
MLFLEGETLNGRQSPRSDNWIALIEEDKEPGRVGCASVRKSLQVIDYMDVGGGSWIRTHGLNSR